MLRFDLSALLACVAIIAGLIAAVRAGVSAVLGIWLPLVVIVCAIAKRRTTPSCLYIAWPIAIIVASEMMAVTQYGWPLDNSTRCWLAGAILWSFAVSMAAHGRHRWVGLVHAVIVASALAARPAEAIKDLRNGYIGTRHLGIISLGYDTYNSRYITKLLGRREPMWGVLQINRPGVRIDNDRRISKNVIFADELGMFLDRLPDDHARRMVVECLTASNNRARFHQGMLVVALVHSKWCESPELWDQFGERFRKCATPRQALDLTCGWINFVETEILPQHSRGANAVIAINERLRVAREEAWAMVENNMSKDNLRIWLNCHGPRM